MNFLGGLLQDVWIKDPVSNQALFWNGTNWVNKTLPSYLTSVNTDGVTIQGDSVTTPISLKAAKTDGTTIAGNGNSTPLHLVGVTTDGTSLQGNGTSSALALKAVTTDGSTIGGNGTTVPIDWLGGHGDSSYITGNGLASTPFTFNGNHSDGTYITGNGLSGTPFTLQGINTDNTTLQGNGTSTALSIKAVKVDGTTITGNGNSIPLSATGQTIHVDGTSIGGAGTSGSPLTYLGATNIITGTTTTVNAVGTTFFRIQTSVTAPGAVYHFKYHIVAASTNSGGGNASFMNEVAYSTVSSSLQFIGRGTQVAFPSGTIWSCVDVIGASNQIDINVTGSSPYSVKWTGWVELYVGTP